MKKHLVIIINILFILTAIISPFVINHKVIFDYLFKSSYMPV